MKTGGGGGGARREIKDEDKDGEDKIRYLYWEISC